MVVEDPLLKDAQLTAAQRRALGHVSASAGAGSPLPARGRITINFHPDRLIAEGLTVAASLLRDGQFKNQFETGISNGSRSAFPGGERDSWERALFGGAYHEPPVRAEERPRYGALDLMRHPDGGSPRFGSCYLVLRPEVNERCTFTWGDSHAGPAHVGVGDRLEHVVGALRDAAASRGTVLAVTGLTLATLEERLAAPGREAGRALDDYVEAQIHGPIALAQDVESLVIDPSFDRTAVGEQLEALGRRYAIPLTRHAGFAIEPRHVPADFRGPRMPALAMRVALHHARGGIIDAAGLGEAAASLHRQPRAWGDWDTPDATLQHLKQLWHVLVRFG